ncbi:hypothetical protein V6N13_018990 [Hibiscus sabdariffa]
MREGFTTNPHLLSSGLLADKMQNGRGVHSKNIQIRQEGRNVYSKVSKDKSYKDALLEHLKPQMQDETHVVGGQKKEKSSGRETINIMASIPSSDLDWLNQCFVGQVSTSEFEDNRCWIDEGRVEFPSEAGWEDEGRSRLEERNQDFNDLTAKEVSKKKGSLMIRERVKEVKGASLSPSVGWTRNQIMGMGWRDYNSLGLKSLMVQLIFQ